jgi:RNA polymerase sigma-70 factor (sigma-E family)
METTISATRGRASFEELYATHAADARRVAYLLVGDRTQAEDITQEAFIKVLGRFGDLRKPEAFRTYLMRTVVSLTKNHFRRRALERRPVMTPAPQTTASVDRDDDLFDALNTLPERQRVALVLRYCEDLSENQTAEILQTSTKAVKSLITRGLAALREEVVR